MMLLLLPLISDIIDRSKALQKNMRKKKSVDIKVQKDDIEVRFSSFFIFSLLVI